MRPTFFKSPEEFRKWLERNHDSATELLVGFYKKGSGISSITWPASVDEALCFGWIDGVRKRVDDESYTIRFTPRKATSTWSAVNIARVAELQKLARMTPPGLKAFERRQETKTAIYAYEQDTPAEFSTAHEALFRQWREAWECFVAQPPSYRHVAIHWINTAKKSETRERRLKMLIEESAAGRRLGRFTSPGRNV